MSDRIARGRVVSDYACGDLATAHGAKNSVGQFLGIVQQPVRFGDRTAPRHRGQLSTVSNAILCCVPQAGRCRRRSSLWTIARRWTNAELAKTVSAAPGPNEARPLSRSDTAPGISKRSGHRSFRGPPAPPPCRRAPPPRPASVRRALGNAAHTRRQARHPCPRNVDRSTAR